MLREDRRKVLKKVFLLILDFEKTFTLYLCQHQFKDLFMTSQFMHHMHHHFALPFQVDGVPMLS